MKSYYVTQPLYKITKVAYNAMSTYMTHDGSPIPLYGNLTYEQKQELIDFVNTLYVLGDLSSQTFHKLYVQKAKKDGWVFGLHSQTPSFVSVLSSYKNLPTKEKQGLKIFVSILATFI